MLANGEHVCERQWPKIKSIARCVIGRGHLRIAIDHDGLVPIVAQGESRVATAVIEFNSLPYAIRPTSEDDDFFLLGWRRFVFFFVCGIKIRREALEFRSACVHALINWLQAVLPPQVADFFCRSFFVQPPHAREPAVGDSHPLGIAQDFSRNRLHGMLFQLELHIIYFFELVEEPWVHRSHFRDLLYCVPLTQCVSDIRTPLGMRRYQPLRQDSWLDFFGTNFLSRIQRAYALKQCLFECSSDRHYFADGLHLRP